MNFLKGLDKEISNLDLNLTFLNALEQIKLHRL